jgi:hypothetical protein
MIHSVYSEIVDLGVKQSRGDLPVFALGWRGRWWRARAERYCACLSVSGENQNAPEAI